MRNKYCKWTHFNVDLGRCCCRCGKHFILFDSRVIYVPFSSLVSEIGFFFAFRFPALFLSVLFHWVPVCGVMLMLSRVHFFSLFHSSVNVELFESAGVRLRAHVIHCGQMKIIIIIKNMRAAPDQPWMSTAWLASNAMTEPKHYHVLNLWYEFYGVFLERKKN